MRGSKSVKNGESSSLMSGVSTTSNTRAGMRTSSSSRRTKYGCTSFGRDGHTASLCWIPDVSRRRSSSSAGFHQKAWSDVRPSAPVDEVAKSSKYSNAGLISDVKNKGLMTRKIKSSYQSRAFS